MRPVPRVRESRSLLVRDDPQTPTPCPRRHLRICATWFAFRLAEESNPLFFSWTLTWPAFVFPWLGLTSNTLRPGFFWRSTPRIFRPGFFPCGRDAESSEFRLERVRKTPPNPRWGYPTLLPRHWTQRSEEN